MMKIDRIRKYVMDAYPGERWHSRVMNMRPEQVFAIFVSLRKREHLGMKKKNKDKPKDEYHQIDIWEYLCDKNQGGNRNDDSCN